MGDPARSLLGLTRPIMHSGTGEITPGWAWGLAGPIVRRNGLRTPLLTHLHEPRLGRVGHSDVWSPLELVSVQSQHLVIPNELVISISPVHSRPGKGP